ncbi:MAG TPA: indolepyruvate ferredoxin oxidoreductase subunit alpha [Anaerolineaceae bacterium]|nr:MAG: indolepyruvate ferredoxin oxidoreductase subunit alpha [Chloroflexi bacterium GWB2_54_36]HAL17038.1 indolepyruvate ferredoxin oxidoreductase subunit alpha [Anaerolineaceae bacterium]HBA91701.1 indolepyruvate ferredoxin oxidoreductase subunit alpha [Anaerolineaceae bacterium]
MKRLLSGNEAVARAAWEAGVKVGSGYPGTPSTEILEAFAPYPDVYAEWAPNEKVGLDVAVGAAYAGRRAFATMKHVGLNVASDAFFAVAMTGIEAGLVVISADDPSMHSSQNEQDNRQFAKFARIPCLDPADSQDAHDLTLAAFDLSEQFDTPVLLRLTTRVCHTSSPVELGEQRQQRPEPGKYPRNLTKYCMIPANARKRHPAIEARTAEIAAFAESFAGNRVEWRSSDLGIITGGVAYNYAREVFPEASVLKLGMVYPLPRKLISDFASRVQKLIVLEELDPFIEDQIRLMGIALYRPEEIMAEPPYPVTKQIFPIAGELDPAVVRQSGRQAGLLPASENDGLALSTAGLPIRPPVLCPGCPHRSSFYVLHKLGVPVNGDIGCYTLGMVQPLDALHTVGCMGASVGVAHGAAVAGDKERHVAVIGDSTFFHSAIPALINVAYNRSNVITIIMDNRVTGMTGHQDNPGTGRTLQHKETRAIEIEPLVRALGFDKVATVPAYAVTAIEKTLKEWMKSDEPAVLITREECALLPSARNRWLPLEVVSDKCNGCTLCFRVGCPAILQSEQLDPKTNRPLALIDPLLCTGCEICAQVCPRDAILFRNQVQGKTTLQEATS